jgi:hypothetical protein
MSILVHQVTNLGVKKVEIKLLISVFWSLKFLMLVKDDV